MAQLHTLDPLEIERVRRFGNVCSFPVGESLWTVGQVAPGIMVILAGKVVVTECDQFDNHKPIVVHGPGNFLGELALLSGRPALVDAGASRGTCHHPQENESSRPEGS
jgi:thioredoxin reductase (NADPH)